jgi:RNA polymerase sigma factor (sigma-70 family)
MRLDLSDLKQAGRIGLLDAIDRFDPNRGKRLSTYASFWIRNYIQRSLPEKDKKMLGLTSSLEATVARDKSESFSILSRLANPQPSAEDLVIARSNISWLRNVLPALPPYQRRVIELIYGFSMDYGDREMDNKEVGRIVGLSRERIRQIKEEVLRKLQGIASKPHRPKPYLKWENDPNILNFMLAALFPDERELYEMTFNDWVSDHKAAKLLGKTEKEIMAERKKLKQELDERYASILSTQEPEPERIVERKLARVA